MNTSDERRHGRRTLPPARRRKGRRPAWQYALWALGATGAVGLALWLAANVGAPRRPAVEYRELPGIDLAGLSLEQIRAILAETNRRGCPCGCGFKLAECRHKDPHCPDSGPIISAMVQAYGQTPSGQPAER